MNYFKSFRSSLIFLFTIAIMLAVGCGGSGGGSSDDEDVSFPTPVLPANAVTIDVTNATEIAELTVAVASILPSLGALKTEAQPSLSDIIKWITDPLTKRGRRSALGAKSVTEDLSGDLCISGKAIAKYEESGNSVSGVITYTNCNVGFGIEINGKISVAGSSDDTTMDYNFRIGGTVNFDCDCGDSTIVLNILESGNEGTGNFSSNISFSMDGIPGGGYLVTTDQDDLWTGNFNSFDFTNGTLIVEGANFTFLNIIVVPPNMADVWLDEGLGGSYFTTIPII